MVKGPDQLRSGHERVGEARAGAGERRQPAGRVGPLGQRVGNVVPHPQLLGHPGEAHQGRVGRGRRQRRPDHREERVEHLSQPGGGAGHVHQQLVRGGRVGESQRRQQLLGRGTVEAGGRGR